MVPFFNSAKRVPIWIYTVVMFCPRINAPKMITHIVIRNEIYRIFVVKENSNVYKAGKFGTGPCACVEALSDTENTIAQNTLSQKSRTKARIYGCSTSPFKGIIFDIFITEDDSNLEVDRFERMEKLALVPRACVESVSDTQVVSYI